MNKKKRSHNLWYKQQYTSNLKEVIHQTCSFFLLGYSKVSKITYSKELPYSWNHDGNPCSLLLIASIGQGELCSPRFEYSKNFCVSSGAIHELMYEDMCVDKFELGTTDANQYMYFAVNFRISGEDTHMHLYVQIEMQKVV